MHVIFFIEGNFSLSIIDFFLTFVQKGKIKETVERKKYLFIVIKKEIIIKIYIYLYFVYMNYV